jgi:DNA repair protein RecO (recombination protein O)
VLRITEYSESSQIVTLWTQDYGKLQAIAKGARRQTKSGGAGMDLLDLCEIVFVQKPPPTLNIIASWQVVEGSTPLRADLRRLYAALYAAELVIRATDEGDPERGIFRLLVSFLRALARGAPSYPALLRFELILLETVGLAPQVEQCTSCGGRLDDKPRFSPASGGALCSVCARHNPDGMSLSRHALAAMRALRSKRAGVSRLGISGETVREIRGLLDEHIRHHLGRTLEMRKHVDPPARGGQGAETDHHRLGDVIWQNAPL